MYTMFNTWRKISAPRTIQVRLILEYPALQFGERRKERHVLFNDAINTFYLRLYGVRHMVKDHSDSERGNPLPPHRQQGFFYMHHPTDRMTHTTAFVSPVVEHWLEREIFSSEND